MTNDQLGLNNVERIGLIAGSGQFPIIFCKRAKAKGLRVYVVALLKEADPILEEWGDDLVWLHLGQVKRLIRFFKKNGVSGIGNTIGKSNWTSFIIPMEIMIRMNADFYLDLMAGRAHWTDPMAVEVMELWKSMLEDGYYEMTNLEVVVFTSANTTAGFSSDFIIPLEDLARMRSGQEEGVIELDVIETSEHPLNVVLSGETDTELYKSVAPEGTLVLKFTGSEAAKDNTLTIRSVGNYNIGTVNVKLVRK